MAMIPGHALVRNIAQEPNQDQEVLPEAEPVQRHVIK